MEETRVGDRLRLAAAAHERAAANPGAIVRAADAMVKSLAAGGTILVFGNGGSAADAQHFAAELVVRYEKPRTARSAIALTADTTVLTAAANDDGFEQVFARQVEALGRRGDVAVAITTSGDSPNVVRALAVANDKGMTTIALTGRGGGEAGRRAAIHVNVAEERTALAQEVHRTVLHAWCELIDARAENEVW